MLMLAASIAQTNLFLDENCMANLAAAGQVVTQGSRNGENPFKPPWT